MEEIEILIKFATELLSKNNRFGVTINDVDLGIVTPYTAQHHKISQALQQNSLFANVLIGTAEIFQGKERPVMIISTVSVGNLSDFVQNNRVRNNSNHHLIIQQLLNIYHFIIQHSALMLC